MAPAMELSITWTGCGRKSSPSASHFTLALDYQMPYRTPPSPLDKIATLAYTVIEIMASLVIASASRASL